MEINLSKMIAIYINNHEENISLEVRMQINNIQLIFTPTKKLMK